MKALRFLLLMPLLVAHADIEQDFDHDGKMDQIVVRDGKAVIESGASDFQLPDAVAALPVNDTLRFLDLNGDGFDDLIRSDDNDYYIALWSTKVKPNLGWVKGWSQFVRAGKREGAANEPPSFTGGDVRIENGELVTSNGKISLRDLIAFDIPPPLSPQEALAAFHVREGFQVELVASEPQVIDPVAFEWDAQGRLWVIEMRDYPSGTESGGVVKILSDEDGDGRYEKTTTFLSGVPFPSGVMPWRSGVLISAAPDIFFAEDTDGDGIADKREVLFTGFTPGNQQHRVNGFEWGLDGWIYAANGDSGGQVRSVKTGATIEVSGRDVRFRPDTGEMEAVSSQSQFQRRRDDFGNWFGNNNPTWLWHVGLPEHYLRRNPKLAVKSPKRVLANYENPTRVFPLSAAVERPNQPWSMNHVTSACSPCPYRDDLFGPEFATSVFISEPVHNAVHREVLDKEGAGFRSRRAEGEEQSEFLASTDPWFRPTTVKTGPDGALYIADFYRFVIEHPEWISPEMQARLNLRAGEDRGRIYRVVPKGKLRRPIPKKLTLPDAMNSPSGWQRDTVQRLLFERGEKPDLSGLLDLTKSPQVRTQAMATLGMLNQLTDEQIRIGLTDPHAGVRVEALRHCKNLPDTASLATDSDAAVRLQCAFSLGEFGKDAEPVLAQIMARDADDEWIRAAVLSSLRPDSSLFKTLNDKTEIPAAPPVTLKPSTADRAAVIAKYSETAKLNGDPKKGHVQFQNHCATCHQMRGEGKEVGPDLGMVRGKPVDWLINAILDPAAAVEARFGAWSVSLKSGATVTGIIAAETANSLTLRLPAGIDYPLLRDDIASLKSAGTTLMPTGFESALDPQAMADLLAWMQQE
jgi:putative membrane-bound dehydrogenase-like protein